MPKRRTRRKKGGKCEYKKVDGKWKKVCPETKKNFTTKKTSLSDSKKAFAERKEAKKNMAKVDKLEKDCHQKMKEMGKKMTRNLLLKDNEIQSLKNKIKELEKMEKKGYKVNVDQKQFDTLKKMNKYFIDSGCFQKDYEKSKKQPEEEEDFSMTNVSKEYGRPSGGRRKTRRRRRR